MTPAPDTMMPDEIYAHKTWLGNMAFTDKFANSCLKDTRYVREDLCTPPAEVTVEELEQIINSKIDQHIAFTPIGQRHATMCIIAEMFPNGIRIVP